MTQRIACLPCTMHAAEARSIISARGATITDTVNANRPFRDPLKHAGNYKVEDWKAFLLGYVFTTYTSMCACVHSVCVHIVCAHACVYDRCWLVTVCNSA